MRAMALPEVDMLLVSASSRDHRKACLKLVPEIGLTVVDYSKLYNIDMFYNDCQNLRDYYRDPFNKLPRPEPFKRYYGKCGTRREEKDTILLGLPPTWMRERQPIVYPIEYGRALHLDQGIRMGGQYDPASCIKYKR